MTRDQLDAVIRAALKARYPTDPPMVHVSDWERVAAIAGMRAAAEIAAPMRTGSGAEAKICETATELERRCR